MDQAPNIAPRFFGYGSLVNRATHDYPNARQETVHGWVRAWRHTGQAEAAFLTAVPDASGVIEGLSADVPNADWVALDTREFAYERVILPPQAQRTHTAIYSIPAEHHTNGPEQPPILLSYLDVVVQGYAREFGVDGVARFFASTHGWDTPILNDRAAPRYPRHQRLSREDRALVDAAMAQMDCTILAL